ncbi:MAG: DUF58 domain-containing protein [Polyangiaceae bacterium]|nr:DUF58 domain-containing protein [Polyangiaceae bacterium]
MASEKKSIRPKRMEKRPNTREVHKRLLSSEASARDWRRNVRVTREGKFFLAITLIVGFTAVNTANNLLYLLFGLLFSLLLISFTMSEISLRDLTIIRRLPVRAQVGRAHLVEIEVYNHKGRIPSYAIEVEDLRKDQPADKRCFFLKISPQSAQVTAYRRTPNQRGVDAHTGFRIATRFPFGILEKSREIVADGTLLIYPAVDPVPPLELHATGSLDGRGNIEKGHGEELMGVKVMRPGEDVRDIYWKKTAIIGQPVVIERGRIRETEVMLRLDLERPMQMFDPQFEKEVRKIASLTVAHVKRGTLVRLHASDGRRIIVGTASGADPVLKYLALVHPKHALLVKSENDEKTENQNGEAEAIHAEVA